MAALTTAQRSTPSMSVANTQQTASVHEYRCLYTRDLHKKAKKWHDGSLRFHTFNQRVMVYDDGKNYIGDLHYRQEEDFGEGTEIQLDRGVKVEVGERLGETQTDLAPLLDRRKPEDGQDTQPPSRARTLVSQRQLPSQPQQRPRSIRDVLGGSQGPIGRAHKPSQSPYEQRRALQPAYDVEPPTKKLKIAPGKENLEGTRVTKRLQTPSQVTTTKALTNKSDAKDSVPEKTNPNQKAQSALANSTTGSSTALDITEVVDLSSDEELVSKRAKPVENNKSQAAKDNDPVEKPKHIIQKPQQQLLRRSLPACQPPKTAAKRTQTNHVEAASRPHVNALRSQTSKVMTGSVSTSSASSAQSGRTSLSFATQPPRRKLMYKALLPTQGYRKEQKQTQEPEPTRSEVETQPKNAQLNAVQARQPSQAPVPDAGSAIESPEDISALASAQSSPDFASHQAVAQSPLFVSQDGVFLSPSRSIAHSQHDFVVPSQGQTQVELPSALSSINSELFEDELNVPLLPVMEAETASEAAVSPEQASEPIAQEEHIPTLEPEAAITKTNLMPPPPLSNLQAMNPGYSAIQHNTNIHKISETSSRLFRRVRSENDAADEELQDIADLFSPLDSLENDINKHNPIYKKPKTPVKLRRTASDTTALEHDREVAAETINMPQQEVEESGPWTKMEAYVLFDWWPADRSKPYFGEPAKRKAQAQAHLPENRGFTSARDMLRDDVNVL